MKAPVRLPGERREPVIVDHAPYQAQGYRVSNEEGYDKASREGRRHGSGSAPAACLAMRIAYVNRRQAEPRQDGAGHLRPITDPPTSADTGRPTRAEGRAPGCEVDSHVAMEEHYRDTESAAKLRGDIRLALEQSRTMTVSPARWHGRAAKRVDNILAAAVCEAHSSATTSIYHG